MHLLATYLRYCSSPLLPCNPIHLGRPTVGLPFSLLSSLTMSSTCLAVSRDLSVKGGLDYCHKD